MIKTRLMKFDLGGIIIPLAVAADMESLIVDPADPDQTPCWAEAWPAAVGMARYIWSGAPLKGSSVLELGAGVGLPGVVCGLKGAAVTFSDFQPLALELCEQNARLSKLNAYRLLLEDWRTYSCRERFDLVLASDIAYEPRLLPYLQAVLLQAVNQGGAIYITHDNRPVTLAFVKGLLPTGCFSEEHLSIPVTVEDPVRPYYTIDLHILKHTCR